jgi:hypothetical protein
VRVLPGHVTLEAFSVLTRLPGGLAVPASSAAEVLAQRFDEPPLVLTAGERVQLVGSLAAAQVFGGASYDGLVALEEAAHDHVLLTLDQRAQVTYQRVGARFQTITVPAARTDP